MTKIGLFPHNGSGNHGCEAIVRSTVDLLKKIGEPVVFSERIPEDERYSLESIAELRSPKQEIVRFTPRYFKAFFLKRFKGVDDAFYRVTFDPLLNLCENGIFMSIGGDLYCYEKPEYMYLVHRYLKQRGCKTVLWGCSVESDKIDEEMRKDLSSYDLICARESLTFDALKSINNNTVLTIDPAFMLPSQRVELPCPNFVGINISPMIVEREAVVGIAIENYVNLIRHIIDTTDFNVVLIPHVVWDNTDDRTTLRRLKSAFADSSRVVTVDDMNCMQLKYIISQARIFVGARTHATIAAYSSCVPTLTVGYSVKSKGIAKDLFGSYENYVLPVQTLKTPFDLTRAFQWIENREEQIRDRLQDFIPEYKKRLDAGVESLALLEQRT